MVQKKPMETMEQENRGVGTGLAGKTKRGSYLQRIRKYCPYDRPVAEGRQGSELEDSTARRVSSRNHASMSTASRNTRKR